MGVGVTGCGLQDAGCKLRVASRRLWVTGLRVSGCEFRFAGLGLTVAGRRFRAVGCGGTCAVAVASAALFAAATEGMGSPVYHAV